MDLLLLGCGIAFPVFPLLLPIKPSDRGISLLLPSKPSFLFTSQTPLQLLPNRHLSLPVSSSPPDLLSPPHIPATSAAATHSHLNQPAHDRPRRCSPHERKHLDPNICTNINIVTLGVDNVAENYEERGSYDAGGCGGECAKERE